MFQFSLLIKGGKMKRLIIVLSLLVLLIGCLSAQEMKAIKISRTAVPLSPGSMRLIDRDAPEYAFANQPLSLLTSYWDYMIGGYSSLPVRVQSSTAGDGVYLTYMGQRQPTGIRRVFYAYIEHSGNVAVNNEITSTQIREGYSSVDIDHVSGKPIFAWHVNSNTADTQFEINLAWDAFLENIPGLISEPTVIIDNPSSFTVEGTTYSDNDFDWPVVQVGPSPIPDHRRVYVSCTNSISHTVGNPNPSENELIAYADFTPAMLEEGTTLTWSYTTIPILDSWNVDLTAWRRPFYSSFVGQDGKYYVAGHHVAYDATVTNSLGEDYVDVLVNSNYGEGAWTIYSMNPDATLSNPIDPLTNEGYFPDTDDTPLDILKYAVDEGGHINVSMDNLGKLHFPLVTSISYDGADGNAYWYPLTSYLIDVTFDTANNTFKVTDLYPKSANPNDGLPAVPWDLDGLGPQYTLIDDGTNPPYNVLQYVLEWPYTYWDDTAVDGAMRFHYNYFHMSKMNDHNQMVAVWADCTRAYLYNDSPANYPELQPYQQVPEIYMAIYPVNIPEHPEYGPVWSDPISLNSIETPEFNENGDPMVPEWAYPGDYVEYMSTDESGNRIGRVHMMFFDDNSWGSYSITPVVGQGNGGRVMYTALDIKWPSLTGTNDPVAPTYTMLKQNYPNPFNPSTSISFNLPKAGDTSLKIYNIKGQLVKTLVNESTTAGDHTIVWNGTNDNNDSVGSGIYFYSLKNGSHTETKKMMLVK
jgi:hypothetical protein